MKTLSEHHRDIQLELEAAAAATAVWRIQRRQKQNSRQHTHHHFSLSESPSMPGFGGWPLTVATPLTAAPFEWNCCCCCCCCCWACCWACCTWNNNFVHSAFNNTSLGVILRDLFPNQRSLYTWRYLQYIIPPPISDAFVNKVYFFCITYTNDSTLTFIDGWMPCFTFQ